MIDIVTLLLQAGDGGDGRVSFRREKYIPKGGPDGGHGGRGGNIVVRASRHLSALQHLSGIKKIEAQAGHNGGRKRMFGADGESTVIEVPVGTVIWLLAENAISERRDRIHPDHSLFSRKELTFKLYSVIKDTEPIPDRGADPLLPVVDTQQFGADIAQGQVPNISRLKNKDLMSLKQLKWVELTEDGQEVVIAQGGFGGRGNEVFKGPERTTPLIAEYGTLGEKKIVLFELRLLADIGLVGFPNAGKSSLISRLTPASPRIASYPFTTLEPSLGVMKRNMVDRDDMQQLVIADIPGLIEGASQGKGLGYDFLRHVEACRGLLFVLNLDESQVFDQSLTVADKAQVLIDQYQALDKELSEYSVGLVEKPRIIGVNKTDLYSDELQQEMGKALKAIGQRECLFFSAATGVGLEELKDNLFSLANHTKTSHTS